MWTRENRGLYERKGVRYPSDLRDAEWALIAPLIPPAKRGGRRREVDVREVMNGVLYVLETGCQWRALPKDLPPRSRVRGTVMAGDLRWSLRWEPNRRIRCRCGDFGLQTPRTFGIMPFVRGPLTGLQGRRRSRR